MRLRLLLEAELDQLVRDPRRPTLLRNLAYLELQRRRWRELLGDAA